MVDLYAIESGFATLQMYSLVSWQADQGAYTTHKLVHAWVHDRLKVKQQQTWSLAALELLSEVVEEYRSNLAIEARLVSHVMAGFTSMLTVRGTSYHFANRDRVSVAMVGNFLRRLGCWAYEYDVWLFHVRVTERILGPEHPDTLASLNNLALVLSNRGKYEHAEEVHRRRLGLSERMVGKEHTDTLTSMKNLTTVLRCHGKSPEAEQMCRKELEVSERVLGKEHHRIMASMHNHALVPRDQGKYPEAEQMYRGVVEVRERVLDREHIDTLASINDLAAVLRDRAKVLRGREHAPLFR